MKRVLTVMATLATTTPAVAHETGPMVHLHPQGFGIAVLCGLVLLGLYSVVISKSSKQDRSA